MQKLELLFTTASTLVTGGAMLLLLTYGAREVMDHKLSLGMLMAFSSYAGIFTSRLNALINYAIQHKMLDLHCERLSDIALSETEPQTSTETDLHRLRPQITLRNLGFRYAESEPWVLRNLNLEIVAGKSVAIVGPSGCGKSTLLKMLLGILQPTEGEILIDGIPVHNLGLKNYHSLIGAVIQDDCLLAGSILENISFFDPHCDAARVEVSAKMAAIHEELMRLPMGYQTIVGDMGSSLSSGQRQRLLLARALYKQPSFLVLDEATNHLDSFNEQRIMQTFNTLKVTRIQVAHRAETIANADLVVMLNGSGGCEIVSSSDFHSSLYPGMPAMHVELQT